MEDFNRFRHVLEQSWEIFENVYGKKWNLPLCWDKVENRKRKNEKEKRSTYTLTQNRKKKDENEEEEDGELNTVN